MTRFLLDTNHAGALLRDDQSPLWTKLRTLTREDCALSRPGVGELWYMVFNSQRVDANQIRLEHLLAQFDVFELDHRAAVRFGSLRAELRRAGKVIPALDALIAAIALVNDLTVVTADAHFSRIAGLRTENWLA
jgi:tRNA(fMet)-specific endonuclease VapC